MKSNVHEKTPYKFKPPLLFKSLSPYYDLFGKITRSERFYKKVAEFISERKNDRREFIHFKNSQRVLDVGCGTGALAVFIKQKFPRAEVFGIDPDKKILRLAQKKAQKKNLTISFKEAFAEDLPFKNQFFDGVVSTFTIHHLPTEYKRKAFQEIYRVLKPKGKFLYVDFGPAKNRFLTRLLSIQNFFEYTKDHYERKIPGLIKEAGFSEVKQIYFQWPNVHFLECLKRKDKTIDPFSH